jgi:hypothetical protein
MNRLTSYRRTLPLLLLVLLIAGCDGERIVGTWQGTFDGEEHTLKFTGTGRLWCSSDIVSGRTGWTSWQASEELGKRVWIRAGSQKLVVSFKNTDQMRVYDEENNIRIDMSRVISETEEEKDSRSYASAYLLLILAVTFGLVAVCRPSRRQDE